MSEREQQFFDVKVEIDLGWQGDWTAEELQKQIRNSLGEGCAVTAWAAAPSTRETELREALEKSISDTFRAHDGKPPCEIVIKYALRTLAPDKPQPPAPDARTELLLEAEEAAIAAMGKIVIFSDPDMVSAVRSAIRALASPAPSEAAKS